MSPQFDPHFFPHIFEANVANIRAEIERVRRKAAKSGATFNPNEDEYIFVGLNKEDLSPIFIPRSILLQHALFLGHPGAGKTARLAALVAQLIRSRSCTVVVISLKPEPAFFQGVREEAYYSNLRFRWLTNCVGLRSHAYNPLSQSHLPWRSTNQRVQPLLRALGLDYGETYGGSWFASNMQTFLNNLLTYYKTSIYSFLDLARFCSDPNLYTNAEKKLGTKEDWSNARHAHNDFFRLAGVEALNVKKDSKNYPPAVFEDAIDAAQLFSEPQVVYLHLSSIGEDSSSRNIAKLLLYGSLEVADMLSSVRQQGVEVKSCPVFFIIDEFEELVSNTFLPALAQARSLGLGCILCLQSLHQLALGDKDLTNTMIATTAYKHAFSVPDLFTRDYVVRSSGEAEEPQVSWDQTIPKHSKCVPPELLGPDRALPSPYQVLFPDPTVRVQYGTRPRLGMNDVMELSADQYSSMMNLVSNTGSAKFDSRWVPVWSGYHIDRATYERREREPFPSGDEGTLLVRPLSEYDFRYQTPPAEPLNPAAIASASAAVKKTGAPLTPEALVRLLGGGPA